MVPNLQGNVQYSTLLFYWIIQDVLLVLQPHPVHCSGNHKLNRNIKSDSLILQPFGENRFDIKYFSLFESAMLKKGCKPPYLQPLQTLTYVNIFIKLCVCANTSQYRCQCQPAKCRPAIALVIRLIC